MMNADNKAQGSKDLLNIKITTRQSVVFPVIRCKYNVLTTFTKVPSKSSQFKKYFKQ